MMGCGSSSNPSQAEVSLGSNSPECDECRQRMAKEELEARLAAVAQSARSHSREVSDVMRCQPFKVAVNETSQEASPTGEEGSFELPDGEFLDGMLGIKIDDAKVQAILDNLKEGELFEDPEFPADKRALYFSEREDEDNIVWLRPKHLVKDPVLQLNGINRNDIVQGILGDCWFLSSCAAVTRRPDLMERVVPASQPLYGEGYKGIFQFRFWRFGHWVNVYIDDQLPTRDGDLIYARCTDSREFWVALIEKAYAKLHGSYEAIEGGQAMDALVDLTSGLAERYDLQTVNFSLYKHLYRASRSGSFITCSRKGDWRKAHVADHNGLVSGHAYTLTAVARVKTSATTAENLLRIRNPWGNETEWKGLWSDSSQAWETVDELTKQKIDYRKQSDGEFWMNFNDFGVEFEEVSICTLGPDFNQDGIADKAGQVKAIKGCWELNKSCGGSRNDFQKFATNPQFLLTLTIPVDESTTDKDNNLLATSKCSVVIALMQEHRRSERHRGLRMLQIGFVLYKTTNTTSRLPAEHFMYNYDCGSSGTYINYREVFGRFELNPGHYVVIPATFEPDCASNFMIRVYSAHPFGLRELPKT